MWSPGAILGFFTHITSLSKLKWLIFTGKEKRFSHSKSSFLFLFGENQAFCIHYMDQLEPVWGVRMYICESDTNTSLWLSERNCKHAHIPSTLTFYLLRPKSCLAFCTDSPISYGNITYQEWYTWTGWISIVWKWKSNGPPLSLWEQCCSTRYFLIDNSHFTATLPSSILGVGHACSVTLAQAHAEPVKSWTTYKDCGF